MITIGFVSTLEDPVVRSPIEEAASIGLHSLQVYTRSRYEVASTDRSCIVLRLKKQHQPFTKHIVFHGYTEEMQPLLAHANMLLERSAHVH